MEKEIRQDIYKDVKQSNLANSWFKEMVICSGFSSAFSLHPKMNLIEKDGECLEVIGMLEDAESGLLGCWK